jgi:hypothetical protein
VTREPGPFERLKADGETNASADEFRADHMDYFSNPGGDFEFVAYYFELTHVLHDPAGS